MCGQYANYDWLVSGTPTACDVEGAVVRGNRCRTIEVHGNGCAVAANMTTAGVTVLGDDADVHDNVIRSGVVVTGARAAVRKNTLRGSVTGLTLSGVDPVVTDNVISTVPHDVSTPGCPGMFDAQPAMEIDSLGLGGTVARNRITHTQGAGILLRVDDAAVRDNVVRGISSESSMSIIGSGNSVAGNDISQSGRGGGDGIDVTGDTNVISGNHVAGTSADAIAVRAGSDNSLASNVLEHSRGCGILVADAAAGTTVSDCTVTGCDLGLVNSGAGTSANGSTLTGNKFADVLDLAGFHLFDANTFGTLSHDALLAPKR